MFLPFIDRLKNQLQLPLPGEEAQFLMSPMGRPKLNEINVSVVNPKKSAVLILLYPHQKTIKSTLIVRPQYTGIHSGQVAFPGGKFEDFDRELKYTALRETHEEIGVSPQQVNIIGSLTDVYISPSNFLVTPFVGFAEKKPDFTPNTQEVEKIVSYDVIDFSRKTSYIQKNIRLSMGFDIMAPCYEMKGLTIWGATAMMISEFNTIIEDIKKTSL